MLCPGWGRARGWGRGPGRGWGATCPAPRCRPSSPRTSGTTSSRSVPRVACRVSRVQLSSTCQCIVSISTQLKVLHSLVKVSSNTTIIITSAVVVSMPSFVLAAGWVSARCLTEIDTDSAACQLDIGGGRVTLVQYLPSLYPHYPSYNS